MKTTTRSQRRFAAGRGFTLLELLAAITLMVILGLMLFQIFGQTSNVVREGSARQQVFQQAKMLTEYLERELSGNFLGQGMRPLVITVDSSGNDSIAMTAAILGRDTRGGSPTFGLETNMARVGYFVRPEDRYLYRFEYYGLYGQTDDAAMVAQTQTPFVVNVVSFKVECYDGGEFKSENWNSNDHGGKAPEAIRIALHVTDAAHLKEYNGIDDDGKNGVDDRDETGDYIGQTFQHVIYLGDQAR